VIRRLANKWRRFSTEHFVRREVRLNGDVPYVSFTFDDFPRTALTTGGRILVQHGVRGTYFVSFGLLDSEGVSGQIASVADVHAAVQDGHDLGCHTFDHLDGSEVPADVFERSIKKNRSALATSAIDTPFQVFAYPLNGPALGTKRVAGSYFASSRGGGQTFNRDVVDVNLLKAYFIDERSRDNLEEVAGLLESNAAAKGWLIFATHDVADQPSPYGCAPDYFDKVVRLSICSGANVLPITQVCREIGVLG
jgi:peptidoglycan/xylan/chitin deacetylase (PgdA/CDA1 family)